MKITKVIAFTVLIFTIIITAASCNSDPIVPDPNSKKLSFGYKLNESGEAIITNCTVFDEIVEIPSLIDEHKVVAIADGAFFNFTTATEIIVPEGVKEIGESAFEHCFNLKKITLPKTIERIEAFAFSDCKKLEDLIITDGADIRFVGENVFKSCSMIKNEIYEGTKYLPIGSNKYGILLSAENTEVESAEIHENTVIIAGSAFANCVNITRITIPESTRYIGNNAFYGCQNLDKIYFYATDMMDFEKDALIFEKVALTSETMTLFVGKNVKRIPSYFMESSTRLRIVTFEDGAVCESIGEYAFSKTALAEFTIPENVKKIEAGVFSGCDYLTKIKLDAKNLGDFDADNKIFKDAGTAEKGISLTVGKNVEKIPAYFCASLPILSSVSFESNQSVKTVGKDAFLGCDKVLSVSITDKAGWCATEFVTRNSNPLAYGTSAFYINGSNAYEGLLLDSSITKISDYAFAGYNVKRVIIPVNVTYIGIDAFSDAKDMYNIFYGNTEEAWENLIPEIQSGNRALFEANIFFYSPILPAENPGKYWRPDNKTNEPIIWLDDTTS